MLTVLIARDLSGLWRRSGAAALPVIFFLLVAAIAPFALGPDAQLLSRTAAGTLWMAALLAALLPIPTLFAEDAADGTLDQLTARGVPAETAAAARMLSHLAGFALPLLLAAPIAGLLLGLPAAALAELMLSLLLGLPGLAALAVMAGALVIGASGGGALGAILLPPLAVPLLIFGASTSAGAGGAAPKLLAAVSLVLIAMGPFAAGAGLRAARD